MDDRFATEEFMNYEVYRKLQFWNWKTNAFDPPNTPFNYFSHVNDDYFKDEESQRIKDVLAGGSNRYLATIIEGDSSYDPLVFEPGCHWVNRFGYVVYQAEKELDKDYWAEDWCVDFSNSNTTDED